MMQVMLSAYTLEFIIGTAVAGVYFADRFRWLKPLYCWLLVGVSLSIVVAAFELRLAASHVLVQPVVFGTAYGVLLFACLQIERGGMSFPKVLVRIGDAALRSARFFLRTAFETIPERCDGGP